MQDSTNATAPEGIWCPAWRSRGRGKATVYEIGDVAIEAETKDGKEKLCRVGSELIRVPFGEIDDGSEVWKVGDRGALTVNRAGFERIVFDGFFGRLKALES